MNKKTLLLLLISFLVAVVPALKADKLDEIKKYFELRDTLKLVNQEIKIALKPDSKSPLLNNADAEQNLTRLVLFLEERVKNFSQLNSTFRRHYARNLANLFNETRFLYSNAVLRIRSKQVVKAPENKVAPNQQKAAPPQLQERPYFHPIDVRTLLSPTLEPPERIIQPGLASDKPDLPANNIENATSAVETKSAAAVAPELSLKTNLEEQTQTKTSASQSENEKAETAENRPNEGKPLMTVVSPPVEVIATSVGNINEPVTTKTASAAKPIDIVAPVLPVKISEKSSEEVASATAKPESSIKIVAAPPVASETALVPASGTPVLRPLAVMIENHRKARPQSGLIDAELVYEMPVEGGITRFMAVFFHIPELLGPVRSCREYFVDRALEVMALYVHCGGSPKGYAYLSKSKINSIDEIKHGKPFHRDNSRKAPHNLYTKGAKLIDYMAKSIDMKLPAKILPLNYGDNPSRGTKPGKQIYIRYHGNYNASYKFDNGAYERYMNGKKHTDRENGLQIRPGTVILQTANMKTVDKAGRQEISFVGSGQATVFYDGTMIDCQWRKKSAKAMTEYIDKNGNKIVFDRKKPVWVQVVSPNLKVVLNGKNSDSNKKADSDKKKNTNEKS
ncbi:MAG: hypothetical protein PWR01_4056 [Clostridiales bacterium]|nr:hypothetical protein [Clostridiales bacterium]MDN5282983.1 hypothetical protein [Candidatus Ozemobacter sp.]